jgi:hypothetical protein
MFVGLSREKRNAVNHRNQRRKLRQDDDYVALGDGISRCDPMANWQDDKFSAARRIHLVGAYKPAARMSADSATRSACKCKEVPTDPMLQGDTPYNLVVLF